MQMPYRILFIEDNRIDQAAFERFVQEQQLAYDCTVVGSVHEARDVLSERHSFDLVISDYLLQDGTAFDIMKLVDDTPIIIVTGTGGEEIAVKAWQSGAYDYLIKDVDRGYLQALPITVENAVKHRNAEKKLHLLSGAVRSTSDSVYITDADDRIIFVNKAFSDTYGYKEEEIVGKQSSVLWMPREQGAQTRCVFQTQGLGGVYDVAFYHRRKDGRIFPVSLSRSIINDAGGNRVAVVATARDITERIFVEDELRRANRALKQQNKLRTEATIGVLRFASESLARTGSDSGQQCKDGFWRDRDIGREIIADFAHILQLDAGQRRLEQSNFELGLVVSQTIESVSPLASSRDVQLKCSMPDRGLVVYADREKVRQALDRVVTFSVGSCPPGSCVEVVVREQAGEVMLAVNNNASSVETYKINQMFDCRHCIKEQLGTEQQERFSLDLPIAKILVEMHGGCIWAAPKAGQGNSLCFTLSKPPGEQRASVAAEKSGASEIKARGWEKPLP
jgi:PAS domain S-box-containing protein